MRSLALALSAATLASAFPQVFDIPGAFDGPGKRALDPYATGNCGSQPCVTFNAADQYVDVSDNGPHPFVKPGKSDIRGLCPGLNAAANHGFLPRDGLPDIQTTIAGLGEAYNMAPGLAGFLAAVAIVLAGDVETQTWSIGGAFPANPLDGLISQPGGISNSHNKYEGDASVTRGDAYLNGGKATVFKMDKFLHLYGLTKTNFGFPVLREHDEWVWQQSESTNPYFFSAPFSGLVAPAAYQFITNFMSNHSAANPGGVLTPAVLKSFYSITGPEGNFVYTPGNERIPYNWYRRPTTNQHTIPKVFLDLAYDASKYPNLIAIGGNTGKVNTFTGVNIADLTGGVYNGKTLLQGNNLGCFVFQAFIAALPDELAGIYKNITAPLDLIKTYTTPFINEFDCPQLSKYNQGLFNQFPGYNYHPGEGTSGNN